MPAYMEQLLREFVDREYEMARFVEMLESDSRCAVTLWGPGGVGKSSLLAKMVHETALRKMRKAEILWTESRNYNYLGVMRKIRDDLDISYFQAFTDLANFFTVPEYKLKLQVASEGSVTVGSGMRVSDRSTVGNVTGILIKDLMLNVPRYDKDVPQSEQIARLTDTFVPCLLAAAKQQPCVLFFDATEKMSPDTESWLWADLLSTLRDSGSKDVKILLSGRKQPELDRAWRQAADCRQLSPFGEEHVREYLVKRGVPGEAHAEMARLLLIVTKGNMFELATAVDAYLEGPSA